MESLLLSCGALASPTKRRFIPALSDHKSPDHKPSGAKIAEGPAVTETRWTTRHTREWASPYDD
jgi:hypothetical protein